MESRIRRWAGGLIVAAVTVAIGLVVAEIVTRVFGNVTPPLRVRDAEIGEHYLPSFDQPVYAGESGRTVRLRFDRFGFRGPERPEKKPAGTKRVAVIGDSMVAALAVEEEETMVHRLERELGHGWEVMNFGVSASSPGQSFVVYRERAARFEPDVVVLAFFVGNDLSDSSRELDHYPRIYFEYEGETLVERGLSSGRSRSSSWLNRNSRFYVWQKRATNRALHAGRERVAVLPPGWWIYSNDPPEKVERAWRVVEGVFAMMKARVEADGRRFVVVVLPSGRQIYPDRFDPVRRFDGAGMFEPRYADDRLRRVCAATRTRCVFLTERFAEVAGGRNAEDTPDHDLLFFHGTGHFTPAGHALAARVLTSTIAAH